MLFIDLQAKQQLNLINSYQILSSVLNFVKQSQPSFTIILGGFDARSKSWWADDVTSPEGTDIDSLTTVHGLQQLMSEPIHLLPKFIILH